jgi:hypothetical protein
MILHRRTWIARLRNSPEIFRSALPSLARDSPDETNMHAHGLTEHTAGLEAMIATWPELALAAGLSSLCLGVLAWVVPEIVLWPSRLVMSWLTLSVVTVILFAFFPYLGVLVGWP